MLQITEDTPPDMLAGAMDLTVHLPNGRPVKMSVERSTPMMDLLVQITTSHHLQLSNYTLQALSMAPSSEYSDKILPFKPNTPIGALDTQHVKVIPKSKSLPVPKNVAPGHQPFESTFRLKVHLPRNQLYVTRVSRNFLLEDIMKKVCEEKNLDPLKYEFKHPGNLDEVLDPKLTLSDYQITEIYVVPKGSTSVPQTFSTTDIMALRKEEERKQMHSKTGGGVFNLIFRRGKPSMGSGSVSSDNRSISPTQSDDSRSVTPPAVQQTIVTPPKKDPPPERPKPPQRKRRPAPKPPQTNDSRRNSTEKPPSSISDVPNEAVSMKPDTGLTICHSRNSSDSSGYHEASILSDNLNTSLPRRPKSAFVNSTDVEKMLGEHSQSTTNLSKMSNHSKSTTSLTVAGRKKKAAPPPPNHLRAASSVASLEKPSPVVASQPAPSEKESLPSTNLTSPSPLDILVTTSLTITSSQHIPVPPPKSEEKSLDSTDSGISPDPEKHKEHKERFDTPPPPPILDDLTPLEDTTEPVKEETKKETTVDVPTDAEDLQTGEDIDWQYQLPSPPKAFRDASPTGFTDVKTSVTDFKTDSVVTSPELFEKLKVIQDNQSAADTLKSEDTSVVSEEDRPLNTLSLDILEKRKTLVYNRELATSLKMTDTLENQNKPETFSSSLTKFESTYEDIRRSSLPKQQDKPVRSTSNTLPNFKLTTYDVPKQKIKVFEDDTVRSTDTFKQHSTVTTKVTSGLTKREFGSSSDNLFPRKNSLDYDNREKEYKFFRPAPVNTSIYRSESFSTENAWSPSKPVFRSKSQLTLTRYKQQHLDNMRNEDGLSKSNSLYDVSGGLQSLEVMKLIQNKLSTPTSSMENINYREKPVNTSSEPPKPAVVQKTYRYSPPAINMGTWSERPKVPVAVKEDADYKLGNANISAKLIVNTTNNNITSNNSVEIKNGHSESSPNVSIRVNGQTEHITQNSNNVVIKIGPDNTKPAGNKRFIPNTTIGYRKPFGNIERNHLNTNQRPHSIAFDSGFDISRVPVVRSVEFKKPYKDVQANNTSVTQIYSPLEEKGKITQNEPRMRVNSFKVNGAPVVRGFNINGDHQKDYITNKNVPFSQSNLRRTDSNKMVNRQIATAPNSVEIRNEKNSNFNSLSYKKEEVKCPPPPPQMPKVALKKVHPKQIQSVGLDPRDQLLESIRNFGGKKGLRAAKA